MSVKPSLHLIEDGGQLAPLLDIVAFLNSEIAGVPVEETKAGSSDSTTVPDPTTLFHDYVKKIVGLKYHVIGVFGGQSSGKSTLLNHVFSTSFQTMASEEGRHQTTKGAFMAVSSSTSTTALATTGANAVNHHVPDPLLVVDFEGTDGAERGEEQSFERQLSLFALSIADTLIINMWTMEVGRFNAANLSLLRTVFEVNLQLFRHDSNLENEKPTLLFVLRDHTKPEVFEKDCERVRASIDKIWNTIHKPTPELEGCSIDKLFMVRYYAFPHYELQKDKFLESVVAFRQLFLLPSSDMKSELSTSQPGEHTSVFSSPVTFRGIPLESVPQYLFHCWSAIQKSKDLDIPSQRELVSRLRCKELMDVRVSEYCGLAEQCQRRMRENGEITREMRQILETQFTKHLELYEKEATLYNPIIVKEHYDALAKELYQLFEDTMKVYCQVIVAEVMSNIDGDIQCLVDNCIRRCIWENEKILQIAEMTMPSLVSPPLSPRELPPTSPEDPTDGDVQNIVNNFWTTMANTMTAFTEELMQMVSDNNTRDKDSTTMSSAEHVFGRCYPILCEDPDLLHLTRANITKEMVAHVKKRCAALMGDAAVSMHNTFEHILHHQRDGSVKFFSTIQGLQKQYRAARFGGLTLAACLFYFRLRLVSTTEGPSVPSTTSSRPSSLDSVMGRTATQKCASDDTITDVVPDASQWFRLTVAKSPRIVVRPIGAEGDAAEFYLSLGSANVSVEDNSLHLTQAAGNATGSATINSPGNSSLASTLSGSSSGRGAPVRYPIAPSGTMSDACDEDGDGVLSSGTTTPTLSTTSRRRKQQCQSESSCLVFSEADSNCVRILNGDILLTRNGLRRALELFQQRIFFTLQVQMKVVESREANQFGFNKVPMPFWIVLFFFAYDEVFYVLTSPTILIVVLFLGFFFFSGWVKEQWTKFEETGPPVVVQSCKMAYAYASPYIEMARQQINNAMEIDGGTDSASGATVPPQQPQRHADPMPGEGETSGSGVRESGMRRRNVRPGSRDN